MMHLGWTMRIFGVEQFAGWEVKADGDFLRFTQGLETEPRFSLPMSQLGSFIEGLKRVQKVVVDFDARPDVKPVASSDARPVGLSDDFIAKGFSL